MEGRRQTTSWKPGLGYRLQDAPGLNFVYLGTTPASAYLEYKLYEKTGQTPLARPMLHPIWSTMLRAQNLDPQSPHYGAIHTAYDYAKAAFDSDDRGANRGWKPDIVSHMVRYMLLTWEEVKAHESVDRQDWYEAAIRAGQWIVRQQNPDGGMPQVIWNDTGKTVELRESVGARSWPCRCSP